MLELTGYQRNWLQKNSLYKDVILKTTLHKVFLALVVGCYWATLDQMNLATNISLFVIFIYILWEWLILAIGAIGLMGLTALDELEKFKTAVVNLSKSDFERQIEQKSMEEEALEKLNSSEKVYAVMIKKRPLQYRDGIGYWVYRISDWTVDLLLLGVLITTGSYILGAIHMIGSGLNNSIYARSQKRITSFVKNLTPDEQDENINDLADRLFNEKDMLG